MTNFIMTFKYSRAKDYIEAAYLGNTNGVIPLFKSSHQLFTGRRDVRLYEIVLPLMRDKESKWMNIQAYDNSKKPYGNRVEMLKPSHLDDLCEEEIKR